MGRKRNLTLRKFFKFNVVKIFLNAKFPNKLLRETMCAIWGLSTIERELTENTVKKIKFSVRMGQKESKNVCIDLVTAKTFLWMS